MLRDLLAGLMALLQFAAPAAAPTARPPVTQVTTHHRTVAFSFDDGPSARDTLEIAALLRANGARATFFETGIMVQQNPTVVRRLVASGMEIGNHGMRHRFLRNMSDASVTAEVTDGERAIEQAGGPRPHLYRLPGGIYDARSLPAVERLGYRVIGWSVDPRDWRPHATAREITHTILREAAPGRIVCLHDGPGRRTATLSALRAVLPALRARGYRVVSVGQLLISCEAKRPQPKSAADRVWPDMAGMRTGRSRRV